MKKLFELLILLVIMSSTAYANPGYIDYGSSVSSLRYLGSDNQINYYATDKTLDFLDTFSTYRTTKIWQLDVVLEFRDEEFRQKMVQILAKDGRVSWVNTVSGNRKFDSMRYTLAYNPQDSTLKVGVNEDFFNERGELMGMITRKYVETLKVTMSNPDSDRAKMVKIINRYLEEHYPPRRTNVPNVE